MKPVYKVGDRVRFVKDGRQGSDHSDWSLDAGLEMGRVYEVSGIAFSGWDEGAISVTASPSIYVSVNHFEHENVSSNSPDTPRDPNPKDAIAGDRLDLSLFPSTAIALGALKMTEGGLKYGPYNYRALPVRTSVYIASLKRHLLDFENGVDFDELGIHSLGGVLSSVAIMVDAIACGTLIDDRPPAVNIKTIFDAMRDKIAELRARFPGARRYTNIRDGHVALRDSPNVLVKSSVGPTADE